MKKALILLLVGVLALGSAGAAGALEVNIKGDFHYAFVLEDNPGFKKDEHDSFWVRSRFRSTIEFVASENLKGVLHMTTRMIYWGHEEGGGVAAGGGGQLDTNKNTLRTHQAYIDWTVAGTSLNLKIGLQYLFMPMAVSLSPIMNTPVAGVHAAYAFNDNVSLNLGWYRPWDNGSDTIKDKWDMFFLALPLSFDALDLTPWGQYSFLGKNLSDSGSGSPFSGMGWDKKARVWHAGLAANVKTFDDLSIKADFIYGALDTSGRGTETSGFFADLKVSYDLGMGRLGVALWYASGDGKNDHKKQDYGQIPSFVNSPEHEIGWGYGIGTFGLWGDYPICHAGNVTGSGVGTTGISLMAEDFTFVEKLTHSLRLLYYTGTNNKHNIGANQRSMPEYRPITGGYAYLLEKDHLWEINFDHNYEVFPGFNINLNCGLIYADWYKKDQRDYNASNMWRTALGIQYAF